MLAPTAPLIRFAPQFAVGFASAWSRPGCSGPAHDACRGTAGAGAAPRVSGDRVQGSVWTVRLLLIDLAIIPAIALLLAGVATGRRPPLVSFLDTHPVRRPPARSLRLF